MRDREFTSSKREIYIYIYIEREIERGGGATAVRVRPRSIPAQDSLLNRDDMHRKGAHLRRGSA